MSGLDDKKILDGLACLTVNPRLQSILFLDTPLFSITSICSMFEQMMAYIGEPVITFFIPTDANEDKLWGFPLLRLKSKMKAV